MYCLLLLGFVGKESEASSIPVLSSNIKTLTYSLTQYYEYQALQKEKYEQEKQVFNLPMDEDTNIFNIPLNSLNEAAKNDEMNLPFDTAPAPAQIRKNESSSLKKCNVYPNVTLNFKTSLLARLFLGGEVKDNYHSVSPALINLMMKKGVLHSNYGKYGLYNSYDAYGLFYFLDSLDIKHCGAATISCVPRKVSVLTQNSKNLSDVIFHIGFEKIKENDRARLGSKHCDHILKNTMELDKYIDHEEKVKLWNIVLAKNKKRRKNSFFININNIEQAVPLNNIIDLYGKHYTKDIDINNGKKDELMVFPCPNSFFVTRHTFITGASLVEA